MSNAKSSKSAPAQDVAVTDEAHSVEGAVEAHEAPEGAGNEAQEGEAPASLSAGDVAALAGAKGKDFRRWLRDTLRAGDKGDVLPGKGGRYAFTPAQAEAIVSAYGRAKASKGTHAPADALLALLAPASPVAPEGEA